MQHVKKALALAAGGLCAFAVATAQLADSNRIYRENRQVEVMSQFINLKLALSNDIEQLSVRTATEKFNLYPNGNAYFKLSLNYRFIALNFKFAPDFLAGTADNNSKGKTRFQGIGTDFNFKRSFHQLSYRRTKGYYLDNTADFNPAWRPGQPYFQFPQLQFTQFQLVSGYNSNPAMSLNSLMVQTERQLKSAGAFLPHITMRYYVVDDKTALTGNNSSQRSRNFEWTITPSYVYNHVMKNDFYLAGGGGAGIGVLFTRLDTRLPTGTIQQRSEDFVFRWHLRSGIGYNGTRIFSGAYFDMQGANFRQENTTATNREVRIFYSLFAGYRLNAPTQIKRLTDKASRLI